MLSTTLPPSASPNSDPHSNHRDVKPILRPEEIERRLKEASSYIAHNHVENAVDIYVELAKQNVAEAQYFYGVLLNQGLGVEKDHEEALRLLTAAAGQGFLNANIELGKMHVFGWGVAKDPFLAEKYFLKAGKDPEALLYMGHLYSEMEGFPKGEEIALSYFQQSAESGNGIACIQLAVIYSKQKEYRAAWPYAKQAADLGMPKGWYNYAIISCHCRAELLNEVSSDEISDEVERPDESSDEEFDKVSKATGSDEVSEEIFTKQVMYFFRRAAELGVEEGWTALENIDPHRERDPEYAKSKQYYDNLPVRWDPHTGWGKVYNHFRRSALNNDPIAIYNLGMMHLEGRGTVKDLFSGLAWLEKAHHLGDKNAGIQLNMMFDGNCEGYTLKDTISCYRAAAQQKEPWALYRLGRMHLQGFCGVKKDIGLALRYFDEAEKLGITKAKSRVEGILNDYEKFGIKDIKAESIKSRPDSVYQFPSYMTDTVYTFFIQHVVAAKKKVPWSLHRLGTLYLTGCGVKKDIGRALRYLDEAESLGIHQSTAVKALRQAREQEALHESRGVFNYLSTQHLEKAINQYKIAGEAGSEEAKLRYLELTAERGNTDSMFQLGKAYFDGDPQLGIRQDIKKSETYFKEAADKGHPRAADQLSRYYGQGKFNSSNRDAKALKYAQIAAENCQVFIKEIGPD